MGLLTTAHGDAAAQDAAALRVRHDGLRETLAKSPFQRPLVLESQQSGGSLTGDVYAVLEQPFGIASPALQGAAHWCDILILHLNIKNCSVNGPDGGNKLLVSIGRKFDQPMSDTYEVTFTYRLVTSNADYLGIDLSAGAGPMGTKDYRISLEAVPIDSSRSCVHMSYAYSYGMTARLAMEAYLATVGRDKVGFSVIGRKTDGSPLYVGNVRGVVERNTMRYFLAIDTFLATYQLPESEQTERRIGDWFTATERYARQLHELARDDYLGMKRKEIARQRASAANTPR